MHTLVFLEPGHFHAALTLRERHPLVSDDIVVYSAAPDESAPRPPSSVGPEGVGRSGGGHDDADADVARRSAAPGAPEQRVDRPEHREDPAARRPAQRTQRAPVPERRAAMPEQLGAAPERRAAAPELTEFLSLVEAFNRRAERRTRWRVSVPASDHPLERLIDERRGDVVVLAGRNDRKMAMMRRLHDAGFHVLADKPWITRPESLEDVRHVLSGGAVAMEIMTGRHEITSILADRLVRDADVFGDFAEDGTEPAVRLESIHHLEKTVNGAPLRRPPWYFDVRVQGDGLADIPTHLVDQAQRWVNGRGRSSGRRAELLAARRWATSVPRALFSRITGLGDFPTDLRAEIDADVLAYRGNAELVFRLRGVTVQVSTRWEPSTPPGGGDLHRATVRGTRADIRIEQGPETGFRRRLYVEPRGDAVAVKAVLAQTVARWQTGHPGIAVTSTPRGFELEIPDALRTGHESHFPLVLDEFLTTVNGGHWPDARAAQTLEKYELLAQALAA